MSFISSGSTAGLSYLGSDAGQGLPIVLLHGIGSNAQSFVPLMQALASHYSTLAWDAPGYGNSQELPQEWPDASDYALALERLLAATGVSRCVVVGHSLGALIAARYAVSFPLQVMALVLISPALGYGAEKHAPLPPPVAKRIEELDRLGPAAFSRARSPGLLADPAARPDVLQTVQQAMAAVRRPGYDQAARLLAVGRLVEDAAKMTVPTAVLVGLQDRITPPAHVRRAFDGLLAAQERLYREFDHAGHAICLEQPALVADAIAELIGSKAAVHA
ncbi:MAG: alpha/beta fold hydrolase [Xanthobacteraceae bacterium]